MNTLDELLATFTMNPTLRTMMVISFQNSQRNPGNFTRYIFKCTNSEQVVPRDIYTWNLGTFPASKKAAKSVCIQKVEWFLSVGWSLMHASSGLFKTNARGIAALCISALCIIIRNGRILGSWDPGSCSRDRFLERMLRE